MSKLQKWIVAAACAVAAVACLPASAHGGPRVGIDFWVGGPFWWPPVYYYPRPYPPVVVEEQAPLVVQPNAPQPYLWYYCRESQMYYPYVKECPAGWQPVTPTPPPPGAAAAPQR